MKSASKNNSNDLSRSNGSEPKAALVPPPVVIFFLFVGLLFWGGLYLDREAGGFNPQVFAPYNSTNQLAKLQPASEGGEMLAHGRTIYASSCAPCHQANGNGAPGQFPPLAGSDWVVGVGPERMIRIVLNGLQGPINVKGAEYNNVMVPWRDALKDEDVAAVLTYVRNEWGNKGEPVKPEEVAKIRAATADKAGAWTAAELLQIPDK